MQKSIGSFLALALLALIVSKASADDYYWTGAGTPNAAHGALEWADPDNWNLGGYSTGTIPATGPTLGTDSSPYDNIFLNDSGTTWLGGFTASSGTFQRINNLTVEGGHNEIGGRYTTDGPDLRVDGDFTVADGARFFTGPYSPNRIDFYGAVTVGNGAVIGIDDNDSDSGYWNLSGATSISLDGAELRDMTNNWRWNPPRWDFGTATINLTNTNTFNLEQDVVNSPRSGVDTRGSLQQTITNAIVGTGGITKTGAATLVLDSAANSYSGATAIDGGLLHASGGGAIGDTSAVTLADVQSSADEGSVRATLWLNDSETIGSLAGGGTSGGNVILNGHTLTTGGNHGYTTFAGVIAGSATGPAQGARTNQGTGHTGEPYAPEGHRYAPEPAVGSGSLVKTGGGTMTLSGDNLYSGTTTVSQGYLAVGASVEDGVAGPLGQSNSAVILGDANTPGAGSNSSANVGLLFNVGSGNQTFNVTRGLDLSGTAIQGRTRIRLQGGSDTDASQLNLTETITLGGRRYDIVAQHQQQLINITGQITGASTTVYWNGSNQGIGVVRVANDTNDYTGDNTLSDGTLIVAGDVSASGPSPIGTGNIRLGDGAPHSIVMPEGAMTNIALLMETPDTAFERTARLTDVATYSGGNGVANGYILGGLNPSGTVTFSTVASNDNANGDTNLTLVAEAGGVAEFTGTIDDNGDAARVTRVNVNQHINHADLPAAGDQAVGPTFAGTVVLSGANTYEGRTAVFSGSLLANNPSGSATGSGSVEVHSGALLGGEGAVAGSTTVQSGGILSPGGDPAAADLGIGTLSFGDSLTLQDGSTAIFQLDAPLGNVPQYTDPPSDLDPTSSMHDALEVAGTATLSGTVQVTLGSGYTPALGDYFDLLDADTIAGTPTFDLSQAALPTGMLWDTTRFGTLGLLQVVAEVPEPTTLALLLTAAGLALAACPRRRRVGR